MQNPGDRLVARVRLADRRIEAEALELLALAVEEFGDGRIEIAAHAHLLVYGIADVHAESFGDRLRAAGLSTTGSDTEVADSGDGTSPLAALAEPAEGPAVGWFGQADGRVLLGAVTEHRRLTVLQARYAAAIGTPVHFTAASEILIPDLTEGVAETVVRVLAPQGFIFDASSPWARADRPGLSAD